MYLRENNTVNTQEHYDTVKSIIKQLVPTQMLQISFLAIEMWN